jgi:potassium/chloride transporter 4/5/6
LLAHLLLRNQLWKNCKLRIFVTAEPGDNSVEMKRVLQDYLRSMRISSEVEIVEIDTEEVEPFMADNKASNMFKAKGLDKDVDVVMKKARQSVMNPKTQPRVSNIPASFSGTWSGANQSEPIAPRSTVLKKMHEAGGLNKKILEHSSTAELVFVTMPPIPAEHNTEKETNYVRYLDAMTRGLQRVVLVRSTGNEVITMYN